VAHSAELKTVLWPRALNKISTSIVAHGREKEPTLGPKAGNDLKRKITRQFEVKFVTALGFELRNNRGHEQIRDRKSGATISLKEKQLKIYILIGATLLREPYRKD
jgi:hypothetical protein